MVVQHTTYGLDESTVQHVYFAMNTERETHCSYSKSTTAALFRLSTNTSEVDNLLLKQSMSLFDTAISLADRKNTRAMKFAFYPYC